MANWSGLLFTACMKRRRFTGESGSELSCRLAGWLLGRDKLRSQTERIPAGANAQILVGISEKYRREAPLFGQSRSGVLIALRGFESRGRTPDLAESAFSRWATQFDLPDAAGISQAKVQAQIALR